MPSESSTVNNGLDPTATTSVIPLPALPKGLVLFGFDGAGKRRRLGRKHVQQFSANLERGGGMTDFTLELNATFKDLDSLRFLDKIEVWYAGILRYRGFLEEHAREDAEPQKLTLSGYGISFLAGQQETSGQFLEPQPVDVSLLWQQAATDAVLPVLPGLVLQAKTIGATAQSVDGTYKPFGDVSQSLISGSAENRAVWGGDVDPDPTSATYLRDRLFIRPISQQADWTIVVPGKKTGSRRTRTSIGDVKNRLRIMGGAPKYPQLLYNGSFERLVTGGEDAGNLILNPSFEDNGGADGLADQWTISGGGFVHHAGGSEGSSNTGEKFFEADASTDKASQSDQGGLSVGHAYTVGVWARKESGAADGVGQLKMFWLDASNNAVGAAVTLAVTPSSAAFEQFQTTASCPVGATGWRVELTRPAGGGAGNGVDFDDAYFYDVSGLFADKWELYSYGAANIVFQNWRAGGAFDGSHCLHVKATAQDVDGQDAHLQIAGQGRVDIVPRQSLRFSVRVKSPAGVTANPKLFLEIHEFKSDGSFNMKSIEPFAAGGGWADWTRLDKTVTVDSATTKVTVYLTIRGDGEFLVDGMSLRDAAAPAGEFIRDGNYTFSIDCDDPRLTGLAADVVASKQTYSTRPGQVENENITTDADALAAAKAYFAANSVPYADPPVTLYDDPRPFFPGQCVRLIGENGKSLLGQGNGLTAQDFLPIARVRLSFGSNGIWTQTLELHKEVPDELEALLKAFERKQKPAGSSSYTGSSAGSPGVTTSAPSGTAYRTTLEASATDPTLHDNYRTGPHLSDTERTSWTGTASEVLAARTSSIKNLSFLTLDAREEAQEADTAANTANIATNTTNIAQNAADIKASLAPCWLVARKQEDVTGTTAIALESFTPDGYFWVHSTSGDFRSDSSVGPHHFAQGGCRLQIGIVLWTYTAKTISIIVAADNVAKVFLNGAAVGAAIVQNADGAARSLNLVAGANLLQVTFTCDTAGSAMEDYLRVQGLVSMTPVPLASLVDFLYPPPAPVPSSSGSTLPTGTSGQTLRYNSSGVLVATSSLLNDGTNLTASGTFQAQGYKASDGSPGETVDLTFPGMSQRFKNGLLVGHRTPDGTGSGDSDGLPTPMQGSPGGGTL